MENFESICQENYERIYRYIYAMTGDIHRAEDVVQEVFLIAYQKGNAFLEHPNPPAFLYKTAKNVVCQIARQEQKYAAAQVEENTLRTEEADLFEVLLNQSDRRIDENIFVEQVLDQLTSEKRVLYEKYYRDQKAMKEIARELNVSEVSLRMRYVRLRREIRKIVGKLNVIQI